jgi:hypothetical protein
MSHEYLFQYFSKIKTLDEVMRFYFRHKTIIHEFNYSKFEILVGDKNLFYNDDKYDKLENETIEKIYDLLFDTLILLKGNQVFDQKIKKIELEKLSVMQKYLSLVNTFEKGNQLEITFTEIYNRSQTNQTIILSIIDIYSDNSNNHVHDFEYDFKTDPNFENDYSRIELCDICDKNNYFQIESYISDYKIKMYGYSNVYKILDFNIIYDNLHFLK